MIYILAVDDDAALLDLTRIYLEKTGVIQVDTATSAKSVLTKIKSESYDAIVSDYDMPEMDGVTFLKQVRAIDPKVPFLVFTGKGREEVVIEALNNGADFYLQKGTDIKSQFTELYYKILKAVEKRKAESKIEHLNRVLLAIRKVNKLITTEKNPEVLINNACDCLIKTRGFHSAWIAFTDRSNNIVSYAEAGLKTRALEVVRRLQCGESTPYEKAALKGGGVMETPLQPCSDPGVSPLPVDEKGIMTTRLEYGGKVYGFLSVLIPENFIKDDDEQSLIEEVAGDIAFALYSIESDREQKRAENALQESRQWFSTTLLSIGDGVIATDNKGNITLLNPVAEKLIGCSNEEANGRPIEELFVIKNEETGEIVENPVNKVLAEGRIVELANHTLLFSGNGDVWPIEDSGAPIRDENGQIIGSVLVFHEVSRRRKAERKINHLVSVLLAIRNVNQLIAKENNPLRLLKGAGEYLTETGAYQSAGIALLDDSDNFTTVIESGFGKENSVILENVERSAIPSFWNEVSGEKALVIRGKPVEGCTNHFSNEGDSASMTLRLGYGRKKYGIISVYTSAGYAHDRENQALFEEVAGDIGFALHSMEQEEEKKRAYKALGESEERFRSLVTNSSDIITVLEDDGKIRYESSSIERILGWMGDYRRGKQFFDFIHPEDASMVMEAWRRAINKSGVVPGPEFRVKRADGTYAYVEVVGNNLLHDPNIHGFILNTRDITGRKQSEKALKETNKKLNLLNSITRHDILNQIMGIMGYMELLNDMLPDDKEIRTYGERITEFTNCIHDEIIFTRDYQNMGVKTPAWFSVDQLLSDVISNIPFNDVKCDISTGNMEIFADPLLEKVFYNLLENANRHGGNIANIRISFRKESGKGILSIEDDGAGVPDEIKEKIFKQGYGSNNGYGLFLVKEILEITGISIIETGQEGLGACFEMHIPAECVRLLENVRDASPASGTV